MKIPHFKMERPIWADVHPGMTDDTSPVFWVFPGISLMKVERTGPHTMEVTCPGCGAVMKVYKKPTSNFEHDRDDCPIYLKIADAMERFHAMSFTLPESSF